MLDKHAASEGTSRPNNADIDDVNDYQRRFRRPKPSSYFKAGQLAEQTRLEAEARRKLREEKDKERRAMSKARKPAIDGKFRLGRQSKVLLHRVKRIVAEG